MKYLFFLLILLNCVFYLWETGINRPPAPEKQAVAEASGEVERIILVKELPETQDRDAVPLNSAAQPPAPSLAEPPTAQPEPKAGLTTIPSAKPTVPH